MSLRDVFPGIPLVESPLFHALVHELEFSAEERRIATDLHERGYAVIDFPDAAMDARIARIKDYLAPQFVGDFTEPKSIKGESQRLQDAWVDNEDIRAIAANEAILDLLGKLYGRRAFPFQTLNFPVGTQQHLHSDSIHFSSVPERFMCGVWLAMENVHPDAGPLTYLPGSHRWPIINNAMITRRGAENPRDSAQRPFEAAWEALVAHSRISPETFLARKGQALIWAANLLHGGSPQRDPRLTRWSQVSHYYFDDCIYYTPAFSDEPIGRLDLRAVTDVGSGEAKPNMYLGREFAIEPENVPTAKSRRRWWHFASPKSTLPDGFDADYYLVLNPDVEKAGVDPGQHYLRFGAREGRRFRRG